MNGTDARTIANRENAKKSTGPRTEAGKARSRANAFQHGLAGNDVAYPGELTGEMQRFVDRQVAAEPVAPRDDRERMLVEKIARIAWLLDRAERAEEAQAIIRASEAETALRRKRREEVTELVTLMETEPGWAVEELLESKTGCRWVVHSLREMIDAVDADAWLPSFDARVDALCSPAQPGRLRISRAKALGLALGSAEYQSIWPNGVPGLESPGSEATIAREMRPRWRSELKTILARRLAEVERRMEELEARPDPALQLAAVAATFDLSEQPERLRRFIRSRERERRHLMAELAEHRRLRDERPVEDQPAEEETDETPEEETDETPEPVAEQTPTPKWVRSGGSERGRVDLAFTVGQAPR